MNIVRFLTAGNVDDGKSTLIGRLLHDNQSILIDQMAALEKSSKQKEKLDFALLTDGLRAEREQGITIDVAYKYFSTPKRKFIIADVPGHVQYTRNMVTGASNSDLIVLLIDARNGITEQTKRHTIIASLLNIKHVIIAVNKMDLVSYTEEVFSRIVTEFKEEFKAYQNRFHIEFIPISALQGDNVVKQSSKMTWYQGGSLLELLENIDVQNNLDASPSRFPVQLVLRPQSEAYPDYRGYAGRVESGVFRQNDKVKVYPSQKEAIISKIETSGKEVKEAVALQSIVIHLDRDIDISRGDLIAIPDKELKIKNELKAYICWMTEDSMKLGSRYLLQHNTNVTPFILKEIDFVLDIQSLSQEKTKQEIALNDIAKIKIKTKKPLAYDNYQKVKGNGAAIVIDEYTHTTVGALFFTSDDG